MSDEEKLSTFLAELESKQRVCPMPIPWDYLWQTLNPQRVGGGYNPPPPLILAAWWAASNFEKSKRFKEHLAVAQNIGKLDEWTQYMNALKESEWHHYND